MGSHWASITDIVDDHIRGVQRCRRPREEHRRVPRHSPRSPEWALCEGLAPLRLLACARKLMQRMGWTVMRLGFMWTGFNPAPGVFNDTYVDIVKGIVKSVIAMSKSSGC